MALEIDPANCQTEIKSLIINALEAIEKFQNLYSEAMKNRKKFDQTIIITKVVGADIAITWTLTLYSLVNYIVNIYVFQKIGT